MDKRARGQFFESMAKTYLCQQGLTPIIENFRSRWGEVDLIMRDADTLVFTEVRFRGTGSFTSGALSVDMRKQRKLCKTAAAYLASNARANTPARFDVVSIAQKAGPDEFAIDWIKNAFECH
ncbi:MAG: YraN family protein [Pseudomonadota bacterium]